MAVAACAGALTRAAPRSRRCRRAGRSATQTCAAAPCRAAPS